MDALKKVASFAEAWIEILSKPFKTDIQIVASFAEAWIEIQKMQRQTVNILSPPSRRRGLKSKLMINFIIHLHVASFAEAWIEIVMITNSPIRDVSPPSRRRGLKYAKGLTGIWML